ncbi:MAG: hypothetical protein RLY14_1019 [Planctomycetota bacterium]
MSLLAHFSQISLFTWLRFLVGILQIKASFLEIVSQNGRIHWAGNQGVDRALVASSNVKSTWLRDLGMNFHFFRSVFCPKSRLTALFLSTASISPMAIFFFALNSLAIYPFTTLPFGSVKVFAGVTSSQTVLVVNGASENSRTIANHYANWRSIPVRNIIVLPDVPATESIPVEAFRTKILQPLLAEIDRRQLGSHIRCIAYSADFPTAIEIEKDLAAIENRPIFITPVGSLNGLTYLYSLVLQQTPQYVSLDANFYSRRAASHFFTNPFPANKSKRWEDIETLVQQQKHLDAANAYDKILLEMPNQFPAAYLASQHYALAGKQDQAFDLLTAAVDAGWCFREEAESNKAFEEMKKLSQWQTIFEPVVDFPFDHQPSIGFEAKAFWGPNGIPSSVPEEGIRYMLSAVLAVTRGQGTSVEEALAALRQSVYADFTNPQGTFYFTSTSDIRTKTRLPAFHLAIQSLKRLGFQAEIVQAQLPQDKRDCLGVMLGTPDFDWNASGAQLQAGAIAENLTSLGGIMTPGPGQTKLSAFIRAGAAASSGTVTEPYAIQAKFPHPMIQAHYAEGATLAEAFYMSVTGPYQLLIVGDPLCQPFNHPPRFEVEGLQVGQTVSGILKLKLKPTTSASLSNNKSDKVDGEPTSDSQLAPATSPRQSQDTSVAAKTEMQIQKIQILIDGRLVQESSFAENISIDLSHLQSGYHEMSLIATDASWLQREWELRIPFYSMIEKDEIAIQSADVVSREGEEFWEVRLEASRADAIELQVWGESLGRVEGTQGVIQVRKKGLGFGPISLQPIAIVGENRILGTPKIVIIQ